MKCLTLPQLLTNIILIIHSFNNVSKVNIKVLSDVTAQVSLGSSLRQMGQVLWSLSQGIMQSGWKVCPHGRKSAFLPKGRFFWHTMQSGVSSSDDPSLFLQWHSCISTSGNRCRASFRVGFLCSSYLAADISITLRRISSSTVGPDLKFCEKLVAKLWGLKPPKKPLIPENLSS